MNRFDKLSRMIIVLCMIACLGFSCSSYIAATRANARLSSIEKRLGITSEESSKAKEKNEIAESIDYETTEIHGIMITYPASGRIGDKDRYIDIESIVLTGDDSSHFGNRYTVRIEFVGTHSYSNRLNFSVKQYDKDGFCLIETQNFVETVSGERVKKAGFMWIEENAATVTVEPIP